MACDPVKTLTVAQGETSQTTTSNPPKRRKTKSEKIPKEWIDGAVNFFKDARWCRAFLLAFARHVDNSEDLRKLIDIRKMRGAVKRTMEEIKLPAWGTKTELKLEDKNRLAPSVYIYIIARKGILKYLSMIELF